MASSPLRSLVGTVKGVMVTILGQWYSNFTEICSLSKSFEGRGWGSNTIPRVVPLQGWRGYFYTKLRCSHDPGVWVTQAVKVATIIR